MKRCSSTLARQAADDTQGEREGLRSFALGLFTIALAFRRSRASTENTEQDASVRTRTGRGSVFIHACTHASGSACTCTRKDDARGTEGGQDCEESERGRVYRRGEDEDGKKIEGW